MTDREKLIELIGKVQDEGVDYSDVVCAYRTSNKRLADYLLANGVTFQKWIPVAERLPEHGQEVIVYSGNVLKPTVFAYQFWNPKYDSWKHITHWMPLPEPPEEKQK